MQIIFVILAVIICLFGVVLLVGAPYLPSMKTQIGAGLDLLALKPGQTMLELGCGDGRVLKAAAERGWIAVGYELNPLLVIAAKLSNWRYRQLVTVKWGNYWRSEWPPADGIYVFLLDPYMEKLDKEIIRQYTGSSGQTGFSRPLRLVSFAFKIPGKKITKQSKGLFLYTYK